jgi:hypothetical protein
MSHPVYSGARVAQHLALTSGAPEGETVPAPLVVLVVFLRISLDTSVIRYVIVIVSDCCFTPIEEFSRHIMARTPFIY